jgi:hypothetical protein
MFVHAGNTGRGSREQVIFARAGMSLRTSSRTDHELRILPPVLPALVGRYRLLRDWSWGPRRLGLRRSSSPSLEANRESDQVEHVQLIVGHVSAPFPPQPNAGMLRGLKRPSNLIDGLPAQSQS